MKRHYPDLGSASVWLKICFTPFLDVILRGNQWWHREISAVSQAGKCFVSYICHYFSRRECQPGYGGLDMGHNYSFLSSYGKWFCDGQSDFTCKLLTISAYFTFQTEVDDIPGALAPFQVGK